PECTFSTCSRERSDVGPVEAIEGQRGQTVKHTPDPCHFELFSRSYTIKALNL
ncbi:uncharacterized protein METZ01_LOCUS510459, partial [marine metagenome]